MASSSSKNRIKGALAASLTAFKNDLSLDVSLTTEHGMNLLNEGLDGVVFFGTTGEGNSLSVIEKKAFIDHLRNEKFPLNKTMIGTGACSLTDAVDLTNYSVDAGIYDCLVLPPFYYKNPKDDGLFAYFSEIIQRVAHKDLKIQIYHFPAVSQIPISHNLIEKLLKHYPENIAGIKDSSGDLENMLSMCKNFDNFDVYAGSETYFLPVLNAGGAGTITATGNITAKKCVELYKGFKENSDSVDELQQKLTGERELLQKACSSVGFSSGLKIIMSSLKNDDQWKICRPPFALSNDNIAKEVISIFKS